MKKLNGNQMEMIEGGRWISAGCGAGVALSVLTGGLGGIIFGPATLGLCAAALLTNDHTVKLDEEITISKNIQ